MGGLEGGEKGAWSNGPKAGGVGQAAIDFKEKRQIETRYAFPEFCFVIGLFPSVPTCSSRLSSHVFRARGHTVCQSDAISQAVLRGRVLENDLFSQSF